MAGTEPSLFEITGNEYGAKAINAMARRDKGIAGFGAPFIHTNFNTTSYMQVARNSGTGGNLLQYKRSDNSANLRVNDAGLSVDYALVMSQMTTGSMLFVTAAGIVAEDNPNLFYDGTNHRMALGPRATAPSALLDIYGVGRILNDSIAPTSGRGLELQYNTSGNYGVVVAFNRDASTFDPLRLSGSNVGVFAGTTPKVFVNATGVGIANTAPTTDLDVNGSVNISGGLTVDTSTLKADNANNRVGVRVASPLSVFEVGGPIRVIDSVSAATTGTGVELYYVPGGAAGVLRSFDASGATYKQMILAGSPVQLGLTAIHQVGFYGSTGATQQAVGTTAATSSAALALLNNMHDALVNLGLIKS